MKELIIKKQNKPVKSSQVNRIPMISKRRLLNKVFFENKRIKKVQPFYKNKNLFIGSQRIRNELPKRQKYPILLQEKEKT